MDTDTERGGESRQSPKKGNMNTLDLIKKQSKDQLVLCFVGVGSAFAKKNAQSSLIIAKNGKTILVDCGATIPGALYQQNVDLCSFDYYHFTHSHSDHIGGVEELLLKSRYVNQRKPPVIITDNYGKILWDDSLRGGCENNEGDLLRFSDLAEQIRPWWVSSSPREMYRCKVDDIDLTIFRTKHIPR